jgi:hypothetical protein
MGMLHISIYQLPFALACVTIDLGFDDLAAANVELAAL